MNTAGLAPRYLRVAHWIYEQRDWVGSREAAAVFDVSPKRMTDDFASIRQRPDIFEFKEQKIRLKGVEQYRLQATLMHPYVLDNRRYPRRQHDAYQHPNNAITWRDLVSCDWRRLAPINGHGEWLGEAG